MTLASRFEMTSKTTWRCRHRGCKTTFRSGNPDLLAKIAQLHENRVHQGADPRTEEN
ncbi:hypothetical protein [Streptomyces sp. gCLA4]|uniref:hypothetical protein n=1 Tax=Streptomyces sp. gCLA4 TaxID=1873416 RepID=UPI001601D4CF|nr:hypothetical protein [Streptomyces sp. gCLA4]